MRDVLLRLLFILMRWLRPTGKRQLPHLLSGSTILYLQYERPLGCCVHGTPLVEGLHTVAPDLRIVVATRGTGAATLKADPGVATLIETAHDPLVSLPALFRTSREVRRRLRELGLRPDLVVQDASSRRPRAALLAAALRVAPTIGFSEAAELYDRHLPYDPSLSLIDNNLRIPAALQGSRDHREPAVYFDRGDLAMARSLLEAVGSSAPRIGFVLQGSGGQRTGWHAARFAEVIRAIEDEGYRTIFLGTEGDAPGIAAVQRTAHSRGLSLAGQTSVRSATAALCLCDLLITVDTGTMHLGRSVRVPMVVLGPSWQRPLEWLPLGLENVRVLRGADRADIPDGYQLDEIEASTVLAAARELLRAFPPSPESRLARVQRRLNVARST